MKKILQPNALALLSFLCIACFFSSCEDEITRTQKYHTKLPVFMKIEDIRKVSVIPTEPKPLGTPGKIYTYGDYLFINESHKGIHIVDNTNPASPKFISFINLPGNVDMAVKDDVLYADCAIDLVAFDISNPAKVKPLNRVKDVFKDTHYEYNGGIIIDYKDTVVTSTEQINPRPEQWPVMQSDNSYGKSGGTGQGGSMARFTIMNNYLYTVGHSDLKLFDLSDKTNPQFKNQIQIGWGIETIFPYENKLFIGSNRGMYIYDASNPAAPQQKAVYEHVTSCDPVVVEGKYAYITLRTGNFCRLGVNQLEVVDIEDVSAPKQVSVFPMQNPHGLGLNGKYLYVCEGEYGLKTFDASDVTKVGENQLQHIKDIKAVDLIPGPKSLIVTGPEGIYQYNYSNQYGLTFLSKISKNLN